MINNNAKPAAAQRHHDDCDHLDAGKMGVSLLAILAMTLLTMLVVLVTMLTSRIIQSMPSGQTCVPDSACKDQRGARLACSGF